MDDFFVALGILLALAFMIMPIVSVVLAFRARRRISELELFKRDAEDKLEWLYAEQKKLQDRWNELKSRPSAPAADLAPPPVVAPVEEPATRPEAPASVAPPVAARDEAPTLPPHAPATPPPPRAPPPPEPTPVPKAPARPLEQSVATWFTRIGAGALLLGALYFFKYAADNEWIGPMGRVLIGAVLGVAILVVAEVIRPRTKEAFVHALIGVGLAVLYVSTWASSSLYQLVPTEVAFVANTVIVGLGAALSFRHKGEAILVLVAVAGFLNPVLLSTGVDRPLALFAYLLLLTSGVLYVAVHHGFRVALLLSILGVAVIYAGWYEKYFQTFDHRGQGYADLPDHELVGAYLELSARIVPLVFSALFLAQWLATAFLLRRRGQRTAWVKPVAVLGLVLAHLAVTSLLIDRPVPLGLGVVALGAASIFSLTALEAKGLLLIPMLAVFFLLLTHTAARDNQEQLGLLYLVGAWSGLYVIAFLRDQAGRFTEPSPSDARRAWAALAAFQVLALPLLLPPPHELNLAAAGAVTVAGLLVALIAARGRLVGMAIGSLVFGTLLLLMTAFIGDDSVTLAPPPAWEPWFLVIAGVHALGHLAAVAFISLRQAGPSPATVLGTTLPGLTFLLLVLISTSEEVPTLRAILTAVVGAGDLLLALAYARRGPAFQLHTSALAALALGLFAPALAFGFSGVTITVLWAALFVVAFFLAHRTRSPLWLVVALLLVLATGLRVLAIDIGETQAALAAWNGSAGRFGIYELPVFFNARAYALLGTGLACLIAALVVSRPVTQTAPGEVAPGNLRLVAALLAIAGYGALTTLLISEVRGALVDLPPAPPFVLDWEEHSAFMILVYQAKSEAAGMVNMSTTMILALVAILLLSAGFALKDPFHRYLGLVVFLATIGKLVLWDVWNLPRIYQVGVLTVVGVLLLGSGFLYARLKVLFTTPEVPPPPQPSGPGPSGAALGLLWLVLAWPDGAWAVPQTALVATEKFEQRAAIQNVGGAGDYRATFDAELYAASKTEALFADLRIADADGREVPYFIEASPAVAQSAWTSGTMYDPGVYGEEGYRATFELPEGQEHCLVRLALSGSSDYLRRTIIETGAGPNDLTQVAKGAVVYSISGRGTAEDNELRYPLSMARYVRITLLPDPDARLTTIEGAQFGCRQPEPLLPTRTIPLKIVEQTQDAEQKTSTWILDAGMEGVPIESLRFEIGTPELARRIEVSASSFKNAWPSVASGVLFRVSGNPERVERLSLNVGTVRKRWWKLTVWDRDDAPLDLTSVTGVRREDLLIFRANSRAPFTLYVGDPRGTAPYYELESLLDRRRDLPALPTAGVGPLEPNPNLGNAPDRSDLPVTERYRTAIGWGLAVVLLGLSVWAVRVLRRPSGPTS
ncbi:MAG: DUF2339 domain-containing protein [Deltaproteobacteria bacterium]|nr:DUF2339 domain-containing protein [Deltaproteobacteria bacterium]